MNDYSQWIAAASALIANPYAQILCPTCGLAFLTVEDEQIDDQHFDRHLKCHNCGAHESVFKRLGTPDA